MKMLCLHLAYVCRSVPPIPQLDNIYGSPSLEDIEGFCRAFNPRFEEAIGEGPAGDIEVEVSSPVRVPCFGGGANECVTIFRSDLEIALR